MIYNKLTAFLYDDIFLNFLPLDSKKANLSYTNRQKEFQYKRKLKIYFLHLTLLMQTVNYILFGFKNQKFQFDSNRLVNYLAVILMILFHYWNNRSLGLFNWVTLLQLVYIENQ